jgi:3-deoxy-D-manno-octulosonic-acid transferase
MKFFYNLGILIYVLAARLLSPINSKAKLWTSGRKGWDDRLQENIKKEDINIWIHCASLGEFEQGRPLIEGIKKNRPGYKIILTFFSPSGYEIRKNYNLADYVCYLPPDTPFNAAKFISIVNPAAAIFIKYEFWDNYSAILENEKIPFFLVSGIFNKGQHFFKWYGGFFRKILFRFSHIFVQDVQSKELLRRIGLENVSVAGDTRFDRVTEIAESAVTIDEIQLFRGGEKVLLAGSSWRQDEEIIARYINMNPERMKWIFAPHEIDRPNVERLEKLFTTSTVRFSEFTGKAAESRVLIIDNIGMLSSAYRYAFVAAVGGGFGKGIHNVLEAACWGIPVIFGPKHEKFREAVELIKVGAAKSFKDFEDFSNIIDNWLYNKEEYLKSAENARRYVKDNAGATHKILKGIKLADDNNPY